MYLPSWTLPTQTCRRNSSAVFLFVVVIKRGLLNRVMAAFFELCGWFFWKFKTHLISNFFFKLKTYIYTMCLIRHSFRRPDWAFPLPTLACNKSTLPIHRATRRSIRWLEVPNQWKRCWWGGGRRWCLLWSRIGWKPPYHDFVIRKKMNKY